ncbi:MAG: ComF family protein [Candidatus Omnitrophica bacterium]|nr:ComF family protein [Candidatus Omnitrophota bacterium]
MLSGLLKGLKDLIYPNCCLSCGNRINLTEEQGSICASCWVRIEKNLPPFCATCGRHLDIKAIDKNTCLHCSNAKFYFDRAFCPCVYTGVIKKLIHEFKYNGKDYLKKPLGSIMNTFIRDYNLPIEYLDFIIPVPLHKSRQREREFNQANLLAQQVAGEFNKKIASDILIRRKATKTQTELTPQQRRQNVEMSFLVAKPDLIKNMNLLLIDDVLTTGSTSNEAAKSLKEAGAKMVLLMTLAN